MSEEAVALIPLVFGVLMMPAVTVPLVRMSAEGGVEPNGLAGIRTRHTCASRAAWVAGHAAALPRVRRMVPVAVVASVAAVGAQIAAGGAWGMVVAGAGFVVEMALLLSSVPLANAAARSTQVDDPA